MAILVARTNLPVWDFQKLASLHSTRENPLLVTFSKCRGRCVSQGDQYVGLVPTHGYESSQGVLMSMILIMYVAENFASSSI